MAEAREHYRLLLGTDLIRMAPEREHYVRQDSPKNSYTREVPSEKPNMERTEDVRIVTNILCQQVTYRINVLSPRVEMVSPA